MAVAGVVSGYHAEAILVLSGVEEIADEQASRIRIAQRLVLERVYPRAITRFVRIASQLTQILEEHQRLIVIRVNHALIGGESCDQHGAAIGRILKQTDQRGAFGSEIHARALRQRRENRINKFRRLHRRRILTFELSSFDKRTRERHARRFELSLLARNQRVISLKLVVTRQTPESGSVESVEKHARARQFIVDEKVRRDLNATRTQAIVALTARIELRCQPIDRRLIWIAAGEIRVLLRDEEAIVVDRIGTG